MEQRRKRTGSLRLAMSMLAALALLAACGSDGDPSAEPGDGETGQATGGDGEWEPEWVDGVLQPLPSGWPDSDIVLASPGEAGSRDGIFMRHVGQAMGDKSPVDVRVEDYPDSPAGGWGNIAQISEESSEGNIMTVINMAGTVTDAFIEPVVEETGLTYEDIRRGTVAMMESGPFVFVQRKDAPWGLSWDGLVEYIEENPGEVSYAGAHGGALDIAMMAIWIEQGLTVGDDGQIRKLSGSSLEDLAILVGSGEADVTLLTSHVGLQHYEAGVLDVLWTTAGEVPPPWDTEEHVVTTDDLGFESVYEVDLALVAAPETPEDHIAWLAELLRAAAEDEEYLQNRADTLPGVQVNYQGPEETREYLDFLNEMTEPVVREIGIHIDDQ